jgi:hypothetical protein
MYKTWGRMAGNSDQNRHPGDFARISFFAQWAGQCATFNKNSLQATKHGDIAASGDTKMKTMRDMRAMGYAMKMRMANQ